MPRPAATDSQAHARAQIRFGSRPARGTSRGADQPRLESQCYRRGVEYDSRQPRLNSAMFGYAYRLVRSAAGTLIIGLYACGSSSADTPNPSGCKPGAECGSICCDTGDGDGGVCVDAVQGICCSAPSFRCFVTACCEEGEVCTAGAYGQGVCTPGK